MGFFKYFKRNFSYDSSRNYARNFSRNLEIFLGILYRNFFRYWNKDYFKNHSIDLSENFSRAFYRNYIRDFFRNSQGNSCKVSFCWFSGYLSRNYINFSSDSSWIFLKVSRDSSTEIHPKIWHGIPVWISPGILLGNVLANMISVLPSYWQSRSQYWGNGNVAGNVFGLKHIVNWNRKAVETEPDALTGSASGAISCCLLQTTITLSCDKAMVQ